MTDKQPKKKPQRGRPPKISRQDIIDAVIEGIEDLTLASVATKLGTTPQALYYHVQSHSEMLELVFRELTSRITMLEPERRSWEDYAFALGLYMHRIYSAVPGLAEYAMSTPPRERKLFERWEWLLEVGDEEGFDPLLNFWASRVVAEFVHGWVAREHRQQLGYRDGAPRERDIFTRLVETAGKPLPLTTEGFRLAEETSRSRFEFALRALVSGLARAAGPADGDQAPC